MASGTQLVLYEARAQTGLAPGLGWRGVTHPPGRLLQSHTLLRGTSSTVYINLLHSAKYDTRVPIQDSVLASLGATTAVLRPYSSPLKHITEWEDLKALVLEYFLREMGSGDFQF